MTDLKRFAEMLIDQTSEDVVRLAKVLKEEYGIEPASKADWSETVRRIYLKKERYDVKVFSEKRKKKS